jgi:RimJ/RimL family protein N-acetyltransferase
MIETARLILRRWQDCDRAPFHAMGNDPRVMAFLGASQSLDDVDAGIKRQNDFIDRLGHGFWAIERRSDHEFLGFCGIKPGAFGTPIENLPEIGWRLAARHWGQGYAKEAALASLAWGWENLADDAIWAITVPANVRSWGLMERIGMTRRHDLDFDFPGFSLDHPLRRHISYMIGRAAS